MNEKVAQFEAEYDAQVVQGRNEFVVERLQAEKAELLARLEQVKAELNEVDSHIAARTPQTVEEPQTEETPVEEPLS